jgi:hypothetical protein
MGSKAFGRLDDWEYGGFVALTAETDYLDDGVHITEPQAVFTSGRLKRQILGNSSVGLLYVGKHTPYNTFGVIDIDGAFRTSSWQLAYQFAYSFDKSTTGFAGAAGFTMIGDDWLTFLRGKFIDSTFDYADQISFVPWKGTKDFTGLTGPRWYFEQGYVKSILIYTGPILSYEKADHFTDYGGLLGYNMQFRDNWGFEINTVIGKARDSGVDYDFYDISFSSWFNTSPKWNANLRSGYSWAYNFSREYLAFYTYLGGSFQWQMLDEFRIGTTLNMYIEGNPDNNIEDITCNARPFISWTPVNDLNIRLCVDNLFLRSSGKIEQVIAGFLIAYNYSPKSWIHFAVNEIRERDDFSIMRIADRAAVMKASYLYYF